MNSKNPPLIPLARIEALISLEPLLVLFGLALSAWFVYKIFLRAATAERHRSLKLHFTNMLAHVVVLGVLFIAYTMAIRGADVGQASSDLVASYLGLAVLVSGAILFVKVARIFMFEYLFLGHMREGVPLLIVNLFALLLSVGIAGWFATEIFGVRLGPVLATSAVFSLILGLALQDTLGNLFAGVALQLDKPYEIGDWIEVSQGGQTWVGQVEEISWRATTLIGYFDELLILPNRVMGTAEISNFTARGTPIWRSQSFKIPYTADINTTTDLIRNAVTRVEGVRELPEPIVLIRETTESWLVFRCSYTIDDYAGQFRIGSDVMAAVVETLKESGVPGVANRIQLVAENGALRNL